MRRDREAPGLIAPQVAFDFVDNSRGYEATWRSEAESIADSIAASPEVREAQ